MHHHNFDCSLFSVYLKVNCILFALNCSYFIDQYHIFNPSHTYRFLWTQVQFFSIIFMFKELNMFKNSCVLYLFYMKDINFFHDDKKSNICYFCSIGDGVMFPVQSRHQPSSYHSMESTQTRSEWSLIMLLADNISL